MGAKWALLRNLSSVFETDDACKKPSHWAKSMRTGPPNKMVTEKSKIIFCRSKVLSNFFLTIFLCDLFSRPGVQNLALVLSLIHI